MVALVLYLANAGQLASLDGETLTIAVFGSGYVPSAADPDLDSIDAYEVSTGDAAGYSRDTFTARWDGPTSTLHVDEDGALAGTFDLDGATVAHYVIAAADGSLVASFSFSPTPGFDGWTASFPNGIATPIDLSDLLTRLAQVEDDVAAAIVVSGTPADGQVPAWNAADEVYEPADAASGGGGAAIATVGLVIAADAVDGSGDTFSLLVRDAAASASGDIPAGWADAASPVDAAGLASFLTSNFGSGGTNVLVPKLGRVYEVVPANISSAWPRVDATFVDARGYSLWQGIAAVDGTTTIPVDAPSIAFKGTGLLGGADISTVKAAMYRLEGTVDRHRTVSAIAASNVDTSDFENATFDYGALRFTDGNDDPTTTCNVWLLNQTDPDENGHWSVADDFTGTQVTNPDTFYPPGQGALLILSNPDSADHGRCYRWLDHDPETFQRGHDGGGGGQVGDWVLIHDPTVSGGSSGNAIPFHEVTCWQNWYAASGTTPNRVAASSRVTGMYLDVNNSTSPVTTGQSISWRVGADAGTWALQIVHDKTATMGVWTVDVDGSSVGTLDMYQSTTSTNVFSEITGIVIGSAGTHTITFTCTARGNSGAGNTDGRFTRLGLRRTA